jgi:alpha-galactosidase
MKHTHTTINLARIVAGAAVAALAFSGGAIRAAETFRVSDLELRVKQDWGDPHRDLTVDSNPLTIAGHKFEHGLGTHANSIMRIGLDGKAESFTAEVGVDDEQSDTGTVTFTVKGDGKKLFESGVMQSGDSPKKISVDLHGVKVLTLLVGDAGDGIDHDHADWADAKIVMTEGKPVTLDPEGKDTDTTAAMTNAAPTNAVPAK